MATARFNYTTYDAQHMQDAVNPCSHADVMVLSHEDETSEALIRIGMLVWWAYSMSSSSSKFRALLSLQNQNASTYYGYIGLDWTLLVQAAGQLVVCTCLGSFLQMTPLALLLASLI